MSHDAVQQHIKDKNKQDVCKAILINRLYRAELEKEKSAYSKKLLEELEENFKYLSEIFDEFRCEGDDFLKVQKKFIEDFTKEKFNEALGKFYPHVRKTVPHYCPNVETGFSRWQELKTELDRTRKDKALARDGKHRYVFFLDGQQYIFSSLEEATKAFQEKMLAIHKDYLEKQQEIKYLFKELEEIKDLFKQKDKDAINRKKELFESNLVKKLLPENSLGTCLENQKKLVEKYSPQRLNWLDCELEVLMVDPEHFIKDTFYRYTGTVSICQINADENFIKRKTEAEIQRSEKLVRTHDLEMNIRVCHKGDVDPFPELGEVVKVFEPKIKSTDNDGYKYKIVDEIDHFLRELEAKKDKWYCTESDVKLLEEEKQQALKRLNKILLSVGDNQKQNKFEEWKNIYANKDSKEKNTIGKHRWLSIGRTDTEKFVEKLESRINWLSRK